MLLACVPGNLVGGVLVQRGLSRGGLVAVARLLTGLCGLGFSSAGLPDSVRCALCVLMSFIGGVIPAAVMAASGQWASAAWVTGGAALLGMTLGLAAWRAERRPATSATASVTNTTAGRA